MPFQRLFSLIVLTLRKKRKAPGHRSGAFISLLFFDELKQLLRGDLQSFTFFFVEAQVRLDLAHIYIVIF